MGRFTALSLAKSGSVCAARASFLTFGSGDLLRKLLQLSESLIAWRCSALRGPSQPDISGQ